MRRLVRVAAVLAAALSVSSAHAAEMDAMVLALISVERLEYRVQDGADVGFVEGDVTIGSDAHKLVLGVEAERAWDHAAWEAAELHALYRTPVSDFFDVQAGIRHDWAPDPEATHLAAGVTGLLPHWVEIEANAYLSDEGDASLRVEAETEVFLTRRIFAQPMIELDTSFSENAARGIGAGLSKLETGLRLHYAVTGGLAPYVGVTHEAKLGETADFARAAGEDTDATAFVAGVRFAY